MTQSSGPQLELIHLFIHVVNAGGFSPAATALQLPVATVSRKISKLERNLNTQLIMRSTRKLRLTEEGGALFDRYHHLIAQFDQLSATHINEQQSTLRICTPISITSMILIDAINDFSKLHPHIQLHVTQNNSTIDLIDEGVDVAIVGGAQPDSSWVSTSLGVLDYGLYASANFAEQLTELRHPQQLIQFPLIKVWPLFNWSLTHKNGQEFYYDGPAKLTLGDIHAAVKATVADGGILYGPALFVKPQLEQGKLVKVLPDWAGEHRRISILYHQRRQQPLKVKLFIEFIQQRCATIFDLF
ncbi:LysR family transcriptional regulator [Shewanella algicola]|uniref:LysR family transcriptional regulator n=1 Tax=Shewanella algicola TaxID=640633 RepID=A0A9X1Z2K8_9GAMM|nr:LysR family transcriptional regulator [Shewanella algicola]MCL1104326.1 LysR family transcriptional regulator [Shewanella algicola]GGP42891.1 LysR family transcriptional regulator [Shewanella algicola]